MKPFDEQRSKYCAFSANSVNRHFSNAAAFIDVYTTRTQIIFIIIIAPDTKTTRNSKDVVSESFSRLIWRTKIKS